MKNLYTVGKTRTKTATVPKTVRQEWLPQMGVYGFGSSETLVLASLVTGDPLMLIGQSGTGKTYLLNSLSEALGLEHRHYNASLISFDDLVGFPYPEQDKGTVRFLETPATIWGAESVLIDEISRCKPEHQNRLFSIIHERRVQGILLERLVYRWAAMNPCNNDQDGSEAYSGSEPLDPALADRFGLFVRAGEWAEFSDAEKLAIANPAGEGAKSPRSDDLKTRINAWRLQFQLELERCPDLILNYTSAVVTHLNTAQVRISPRRSRFLARSLLAATIVRGKSPEKLFRQVLQASLPHTAWGFNPKPEVVAAAHRAAWDSARAATGAWIHAFLAAPTIAAKVRLLTELCRDKDEGSQAVAQLIAMETRETAAAFAFVTYPAALMGKLAIGAEGVNDLAKIAADMYTVKGEITWQERFNVKDSTHPEIVAFSKVLSGLKGGRRERAQQFFNWCLIQKVIPVAPSVLEADMNSAVVHLAKLVSGAGDVA